MSPTLTFSRARPMLTFVYDVVVDMLHPVRARAGQVLVWRPGTDQPILVVMRGTTETLRDGPQNINALRVLLDEGVLTPRSDASRLALTDVSAASLI